MRTHRRATLSLVLLGIALLSFTACDSVDSNEPEPEGPEPAAITLDLRSVTANGNCDSSSNPGDYQFLIEVADLGNNPIERIDLPVGGTYGEHSEPTVMRMYAGDKVFVNRSISMRQPREAGSGFAISLSAMEWDSATLRDGRMDDRSSRREHAFSDGRFVNVVGEQTVRVRGSVECDVVLEYTVTVQ